MKSIKKNICTQRNKLTQKNFFAFISFNIGFHVTEEMTIFWE